MNQDHEIEQNNKTKVLLIEDERHIAEGIILNLELMGHDVVWAKNGLVGLQKWKEVAPHLIVLDIMMPELDGISVLKAIRKVDERLPILILSAKNESTDKVKAFKEGVDDYLSKPFSLDEFILRIERLVQRSKWTELEKSEEVSEKITFGLNTVFPLLFRAQTQKGPINLTEQELKVLQLFFKNPNIPLNRKQLLEVGWGYSQEINTRTLDNFIVRFRKYFEVDPKNPIHFQSVRGVGYLWSPEGTTR